MADSFFALSQNDKREALEYVRAESGRPAHLLEKDIWVVWVLRTLFEAPIGADLTFKGGTSLSKVYGIIDRFSEDIDVTYDIRKLIPDLVADGGELPSSRSQAGKWTKAVRNRLPGWIKEHIQPLIETALGNERLKSRVELGGRGNDKLLLHYPGLTKGTGYIAPVVTLEFGGRATGEPRQIYEVVCDAAEYLSDLVFPTASPQVMCLTRTFWEKATAAHVFCAQSRLRGERFARHWHDLAAIGRAKNFSVVAADLEVAAAVASHKGRFFIERDMDGHAIDYTAATGGHLKIVPEGAARTALREDYEAMLTDGVMIGEALTFEALMDACAELEERINGVSD